MLTVDEAIGHALLETEHIGGFARRGPYIRALLRQDGYDVLPRNPEDHGAWLVQIVGGLLLLGISTVLGAIGGLIYWRRS